MCDDKELEQTQSREAESKRAQRTSARLRLNERIVSVQIQSQRQRLLWAFCVPAISFLSLASGDNS